MLQAESEKLRQSWIQAVQASIASAYRESPDNYYIEVSFCFLSRHRLGAVDVCGPHSLHTNNHHFSLLMTTKTADKLNCSHSQTHPLFVLIYDLDLEAVKCKLFASSVHSCVSQHWETVKHWCISNK